MGRALESSPHPKDNTIRLQKEILRVGREIKFQAFDSINLSTMQR